MGFGHNARNDDLFPPNAKFEFDEYGDVPDKTPDPFIAWKIMRADMNDLEDSCPATKAFAEAYERLHSSYQKREFLRLKFPTSIDQLSLWIALYNPRADGVTDVQIADQTLPLSGRKVLGQLKTAKSRGTVSDWRQEVTDE